MASKVSLVLPSPAKINRFLHIIGQRKDGYHLLQTLFQFVDFGDELQFELRTDNRIVLNPSSQFGIRENENLIMKAAVTLQNKAPSRNFGVTISWQKKIPLGAGLGGGSSNAATCLFALNYLWQLDLPLNQLMKIAETLGADIPFFLYGHTAWGEGIGEQLSLVKLSPSWMLIVTPPCQVETRHMYAHPDLTRNTPTLRIGTLIQDDVDETLNKLGNDFEPLVRRLYPEVDAVIKWLSDFGIARLSGSGASAFVCFSTYEQAKKVSSLIPPSWKSFLAKGINKSPLLSAADRLGIKYILEPV